MRLLVATPLYPPEPGGPATYAAILEAELPARGIETAVLKFGDVRRFPKLVRHIAYFALLVRAGKDADAILALDPVSTGLPACLAAMLLRKRFYVKVVGDYAWEQGTQRAGIRLPLEEFVRTARVPLLVALLRRVQSFVALRAHRVIVPSRYLAGIVRTWGVPEERLRVIYNAFRLEDPRMPELPERARPRVVSAGRLVPWKGFSGLIDAMARVRKELPEATLAIAGDGPDRESLSSYAKVRLGDAALFTGALPHADTLGLIRDADIFVLNSTYEGLSHLLIEALSLGVPVIATDAGGNPELIEDGKNGLLVPVGDRDALAAAILHLLRTPPHAKRLATAAASSGERFTMDEMVGQLAQLITNDA